MNTTLESYSSSDFQKIKNILLSDMVSNISAVACPCAYVLGGQSGAGKTTLQNILGEKHDRNIITINGDEFRQYHPNFKQLQDSYKDDYVRYTNSFSGKLTEALISELSKRHYNLIIEGTLRTTEIPLSTCKVLQQEGYHVELALMAVKPQLSYVSTVLRYEIMLSKNMIARATSKESHDEIAGKIIGNLDQIYKTQSFDNITIYNREKECLYNQSENCHLNPAAILYHVFNSNWSIEEKNNLIDILSETQKLMEARNAPELSGFLFNCHALLSQFKVPQLPDDSLQSRLEAAIHTSKEYEEKNGTPKIKRDNQHEL